MLTILWGGGLKGNRTQSAQRANILLTTTTTTAAAAATTTTTKRAFPTSVAVRLSFINNMFRL
jgi:hypothetical protein